MEIKEIVKEKYGLTALRVTTRQFRLRSERNPRRL
jgi:hypothetical protein